MANILMAGGWTLGRFHQGRQTYWRQEVQPWEKSRCDGKHIDGKRLHLEKVSTTRMADILTAKGWTLHGKISTMIWNILTARSWTSKKSIMMDHDGNILTAKGWNWQTCQQLWQPYRQQEVELEGRKKIQWWHMMANLLTARSWTSHKSTMMTYNGKHSDSKHFELTNKSTTMAKLLTARIWSTTKSSTISKNLKQNNKLYWDGKLLTAINSQRQRARRLQCWQ